MKTSTKGSSAKYDHFMREQAKQIRKEADTIVRKYEQARDDCK